MKNKSIRQIRNALRKIAWDANHDREAHPLLVVYPNELLLELFGEKLMNEFWIDDRERVLSNTQEK